MDDILVLCDVRKKFGQTEAVKGISFSVRPGEVFGLIGPNGAGSKFIKNLEAIQKLGKKDHGQ